MPRLTRPARLAAAVVASCAVLLLSCGENAFTPDETPTYNIDLSVPQVDVEEGEATEIEARLVDQKGRPAPASEAARYDFIWLVADTAVAAIVESNGSVATVEGRHEGEVQIEVEAVRRASTSAGATAGAARGPWRRFWVFVRAGSRGVLTVTSGNQQTGVAGRVLADPVVVRLVDRDGNPIAGTRIQFQPSAGEATPSASDTDDNGNASARWRLGEAVGPQSLSVEAFRVQTIVVTATATAPTAESLNIVSGDGQTAIPEQQLNPLRVVLQDGTGSPIKDAEITWAVTSGGGSITPPTSITDSLGNAAATWTVGTTAGSHKARAVHGSLSADFTATVEAGPADQIVRMSGNVQSAEVGANLPDSIVVRVTDAHGNNVSGANVVWTVISGGGSVSPSQSPTGANGLARTLWRMGTNAGNASLRASVQNVGFVTFSATALEPDSPPPPPPVSRVVVTPETLALDAIGASSTLTARAYDSNNQVVSGAGITWTSSNPSYATVDTLGRVTARGLGTALVIAASVCCDAADTTSVTVTQRVASLAVSPRSLSLETGATGTLSVTARDANSNVIASPNLTWSSSNTAVADVSGGTVTAKSAGSAIIRVVSGSVRDSASITVQDPQPQVSRVVVTPSSASLQAIGAQIALSAVAYDANNEVVSNARMGWSSLNSTIATVDSMGRVTARAVGTAMIVATALCCGRADTTGISVEQQVASLDVTPGTLSLNVGSSQTLAVTARDSNGNVIPDPSVNWSTNNPSVATVTNGHVQAVGAGVAYVRAVAGAVRDSSRVSVTSANPPPSQIDTIFYDGFESGNLNAWQDGYNPSLHRVLTNSTLAYAGSRVLEMSIPANQEGGHLARFFMPGYDSLFVRMYVRYSANWTGNSYLALVRGSRTDNQWSAFGQAGSCPNGTNFFAANVTTNGSGSPGPTTFYTYYVGMPREGDGVTCWGDYGASRATYYPQASMTRDQWHRIEFWIRLNNPGQTNSIQRVWVNGELRGEWNGLNFRTTNDLKLNSLTILAYGNPTGQARQIYYDEVLVTTAPVAGSNPPPSPPPAPAPVATVQVTPGNSSVVAGSSQQFNATLRDAEGNVLSGRTVTWSSSNSGVASVNNSGLASALSTGTATITATSEGVSGTASMQVTPAGTFPAPDLASHNFDNGSWGPYNPVGTRLSIIDDPTNSGRGKVAQIRYVITGSPTHKDDNQAFKYEMSSGLHLGDSLFFRGDVYLPRPSANLGLQRKLLYWQAWSLDANQNVLTQIVAMNRWGSDLSYVDATSGGTASAIYEIAKLEWDRWYTVEVQVVMNTAYNRSDGIIRWWINGQLVWEHTGHRWIPDSNRYVRHFLVGQQVDRVNGESVDEIRYWDRVAFSTRRIGPN